MAPGTSPLRFVSALLFALFAASCSLNTAGEWPTDGGDAPGEGSDGDVVRPDDAAPDRDDGTGDGGETDGDDPADESSGDDGGDDGPAPVCGDGTIDPGEECDDGTLNSDIAPGACRTDCGLFRCGDGVQDPGEACDDGNTVDGDGCESDCSLITCGDGVVEGAEECDDGNADNTDDCLDTCVAASCGDGYLWATLEECDRDPPVTCDSTCGSTGRRSCVACAWETACTPPAETCNAADDDCDGATDNGFPCVRGANEGCTSTCGSTGSRSCGAACAWDPCAPPAETCNGADDDCDGATDNGFACAAGAARACSTACGSAGTETCSASCAWGACAPPAEICNGADDDCVSGCDNGFTCCAGTAVPCIAGCGSTGTGTCTAACAVPTGSACTAPAEACNGADDDCDGATDNGFACARGATRACTTTCASTGTQTCDAACVWGACAPPAEACNGADDDCDGSTDEGFACAPGASRSCTTSCGSTGTQACSAATCDWGGCTPPTETCNGRDDDCDGSTDEGLGTCNDACVNAVDISALTTVSGSTSSATSDNAGCAGSCSTTARDVWYRFTLAAREVVYLSTLGATWDTVIDIRRGTSCGSLTAQACRDDSCGTYQSQWAGVLNAGTYYVAIDGCAAGDAGAFTLTYLHSPCPGAIAAGAAGRFTGNSCGGGNDTSASCGGSNSEEVPYFFPICPGSRTVHADDCDGRSWNAAIYIRRGGGGTCGGTAVGCGGPGGCGFLDPRASVDATITGPDLVFVVQDGWSVALNSCGAYSLDLSW